MVTVADAAAGVGATVHGTTPERRQDIQRLDADTEVLLLRLVHINMLHLKVETDPERGTTPAAQPDMRPTFGQRVKESDHRTYYRNGRYYCVECSLNFSSKNALNNHTQRKHTGQPKQEYQLYMCDECPFKVYTRGIHILCKII